MYVGNLAVYETAHQNIFRGADGAGEQKDLVTSWMAPPAASDGLAGHRLG